MATHVEKLATSLEILKNLIGNSKRAIFSLQNFRGCTKNDLLRLAFLWK